ncbi:MAG: transglutaminase domain-containing protein [Aristaeellaceae bacterium]
MKGIWKKLVAWLLVFSMFACCGMENLTAVMAIAEEENMVESSDSTVTDPTEAPTAAPTAAPTEAPTEEPTAAPTEAPTEEPTAAPTEAPTEEPTAAPAEEPTEEPTEAPAEESAEEPTAAPSEEPAGEPAAEPSEEPAAESSEEPAEEPTEAPAEPFEQSCVIDQVSIQVSAAAGVVDAGTTLRVTAEENEKLAQAVEQKLGLADDASVVVQHAFYRFTADAPLNGTAQVRMDNLGLARLLDAYPGGTVKAYVFRFDAADSRGDSAEEMKADLRVSDDRLSFDLSELTLYDVALVVTLPEEEPAASDEPAEESSEESSDEPAGEDDASAASREFTGFGSTVTYVGGVIDRSATATYALTDDLTVAYVTLNSVMLEVGKESVWEVTAQGGEEPYTFYYCLFMQSLDDTGNIYSSVSGSSLTTSSSTYTFVIPEEGRYMLQFRITDANGDSLTFQSHAFETSNDELTAKVTEVVSSCTSEGMSDYAKALALHDWLCSNATYDDSLTRYDPAGVLLDGTGVCQSFAQAYQMLLTEAGVENVYVTGGNHAWNMVKLDGDWVHVDVTWDEDSTDRYYFGMSTALITRDHTIADRVPTATTDRFNYALNASDGAFSSLDELPALLAALPASQGSFRFYYTGSEAIGSDYMAWFGDNSSTYSLLSASYVEGSYTHYISGTRTPGEETEEPEETPETTASRIIGVWYDKGIEATPLMIHVTTDLDAQVLYLYQGDTLLTSWQASEATINTYESCKEWHVSYTFEYPGNYNLTYQASADGVEMSDSYTESVTIERPALLDVWYEPGIENKPLMIHVTTNLDQQYLYMYLGDDLLGSWSADEAEITTYATCKEWAVSYTFSDPGRYNLWYKASVDGSTLSQAYAPNGVDIERPAVIDVWYEPGIENKPLMIHATTNLDQQYLYMYLGDDLLGTWSAEEAEITTYSTCKEWAVSYTFSDPGRYNLWYKASVDGSTLSQAYAPNGVDIERPAVIDVWYEPGIENKPLMIHATTNLDQQYLYMYLGDDLLGTWSAEEAEITTYATCKEWTVEYTFSDPGRYNLWYKASVDGVELSQAYAPNGVDIERPAVLEVWYEDGLQGVPLAIHATTNLNQQYLYMYLDEDLLYTWSAEEAEITTYDSCKEWVVEYTFADYGTFYLWYKASVDGEELSQAYATDPVTIQPNNSLPAPVVVSIEQLINDVEFIWQAVAGAEGYEVSMRAETAEEYTIISETVDCSMFISGFVPDTTYLFRVRAYYINEVGEKVYSTLYSDPVSLTFEYRDLMYDELVYALTEDGTGIVIKGYQGSDATVVVPDTIDDLPIKEIGAEAFMNNTTLQKITLPDTVEVIGARAFSGCTSLSEMD